MMNIIEQQKGFAARVRFEDCDGVPVRMPSYDWFVSLFGDEPGRRIVVAHVNGDVYVSGSATRGSCVEIDEDECGFVLRTPMLSVGQGLLRYKAVVEEYDEQGGQKVDSGCTDCKVVSLTRGHWWKRLHVDGVVDEVAIEVGSREMDWWLESEDGLRIETEDGELVDMRKMFNVQK